MDSKDIEPNDNVNNPTKENNNGKAVNAMHNSYVHISRFIRASSPKQIPSNLTQGKEFSKGKLWLVVFWLEGFFGFGMHQENLGFNPIAIATYKHN